MGDKVGRLWSTERRREEKERGREGRASVEKDAGSN